MPEQKGRKRRRERQRRHGGGALPVGAPPAEPRAREQQADTGEAAPAAMPSPTARVTGLLIAVVTALAAGVMIANAVSGGPSGVDGIARVVAGVLLILLAVAVAALVLAPDRIRAWVRRT